MKPTSADSTTARALRGLLAGVILGAITCLFTWGTGGPAGFPWGQAVLVVLAAVGVCVAGQLAARGISGAALGALLGFIVCQSLAGPPPVAQTKRGEQAQVAGPTLDGKTFDVANEKGKVVLVDFWATWCTPCIKELPRIKQLKEKYEEQGLRVVGVSSDRSRDELEEFVTRNRLDWPQIFFAPVDDRPARNPISLRYNVEYIPHTLLIDREGRIVAEGLRGDELERAVEKTLAGEATANTGSGIPAHLAMGVIGLVGGCVAGIWFERSLRANPKAAP
jgi:thiol-disulfide isomerase/thioredoxin